MGRVATAVIAAVGLSSSSCDRKPAPDKPATTMPESKEAPRATLVDLSTSLAAARAAFKKGWLKAELAQSDLAALLKRVETDAVLKKMPRGEDDPPSLTEKALLRDIIEFMRAVHAEMAAIASAARRGVSVNGCIMYATTFPCHECARHIVMVGIGEVYFIDPYPKSRVPEMFDDSIVVDREASGKVPFRAFTGIAPRLFADAFAAPNRRDGEKWVDWEKCRAHQMPRRSASPNMYLEKEDEALKLLKIRMREKKTGVMR